LDAIEEDIRLEKEKKEKEEKERLKKEKEEQEREEAERAKALEEKEKKDKKAREEAKFHQRNCDKMIATTFLDLTTKEEGSAEKSLALITTTIQKHQWTTLQEYAKEEIPTKYYETLISTFTETQKSEPKPMLSLNMTKDNAENTNKLFADQEYHNHGNDESSKDKTLIFVPHSATARAILATVLEEKFPEKTEVPHTQHEQQKKVDFNDEELTQVAQEVTKKFWLSCLINKSVFKEELRQIRQYTAKRTVTVMTYMTRALQRWDTSDLEQSMEFMFGEQDT
jgi:hypothetical protein